MKKIKIVITGAESVGKSTLANELAEYYKTIYVPEFARQYVENLNKPYTYEDLVFIAKKQISLETEYLKKVDKILFVDTSLIVTKIWFKVVFNKSPKWLDKKIFETKADIYLLCNNDVKWEQDNVRENGGIMRDKLFEMYLNEFKKLGAKYFIIKEKGNKRTKNAISYVNEALRNNTEIKY